MSRSRRPHGAPPSGGAEAPGACVPDAHGRCGVCADEGRIGDVVEVSPDASHASVRFAAGIASVDLALMEGVQPGDRLLVHLDTALAVVEDPS